MFEATLDQVDGQRGRLGTGTLISVTAHALILGLLLFSPTPPREAPAEPPEVKLLLAAGPPGGGPGPRAAAPAPAQAARPAPRKRRAELVLAPKQPAPPADEAKAPDVEPGPEVVTGDVVGGEGDGPPGGGGDGPPGGGGRGGPGGPGSGLGRPAPPPPPTSETMPFGPGMERPALLSGPQPVYPREALAAKVEGMMLVKCVITTAGTLRSCRILKGLPYMERPVLDALAQYRYRPVVYQGRPINLEYVIPLKFKLQ